MRRASIGVHDPNRGVNTVRFHARERDPLAIGRPTRLHVPAQPRTRELCNPRPIGSRREQRVRRHARRGRRDGVHDLARRRNDPDDAAARAVRTKPNTTTTAARFAPILMGMATRSGARIVPAAGGGLAEVYLGGGRSSRPRPLDPEFG